MKRLFKSIVLALTLVTIVISQGQATSFPKNTKWVGTKFSDGKNLNLKKQVRHEIRLFRKEERMIRRERKRESRARMFEQRFGASPGYNGESYRINFEMVQLLQDHYSNPGNGFGVTFPYDPHKYGFSGPVKNSFTPPCLSPTCKNK